MYILNQTPRFFWPVKVFVPDNGKQVEVTFEAEFERPTDSEMKELFAKHQRIGEDAAGATRDQALREGFDALVDELADRPAPDAARCDALFERLRAAAASVASPQEALNQSIDELRDWHENLVQNYMRGWKGIGGAGDKGDQDAAFNEENLEKLLGVLGARAAIATAFLDAISGKAQEKNSRRSRAAG